MVNLIDSYRAGYSSSERQELELDFIHNRRQVLVSTSALEVGIDIGSLDATVTVGFPQTICSLRQQAGALTQGTHFAQMRTGRHRPEANFNIDLHQHQEDSTKTHLHTPSSWPKV